MKSIIKRLLHEALELPYRIDSGELQRVFNEGKKFFPKLKMFNAKTKNDPNPKLRFFENYPKNRASFSLGGFKAAIASKKTLSIVEWLGKAGVNDVSYSKTTNSVYFSINNTKVRISDHGSKAFEGVNILITWDTNPLEIINKLYELFK